MASSDSHVKDESTVKSETNEAVTPIYDVPKSVKRQTSDGFYDRVADGSLPMKHKVDTEPAEPQGNKFQLQQLSTGESGYVKMVQIQDSNKPLKQNSTAEQSLHEYDNIDESKLEKVTNQLGSKLIRNDRPDLPPRPTTTLKPSNDPLRNSPLRHSTPVPDIYNRNTQTSTTIKHQQLVPVPVYEGSATISSAFGRPTQICRHILIRGITDRLSTKDITRHLEADILDLQNVFEDLRVNRTNVEAIIALRSIAAIDELLDRAKSGETFTLGDTEVEILPYKQPPIDEKKVFLCGLARDKAAEDISAFVKSILVDRPCSVVIGESPGTALLCLENSADTLMLKDGLRDYNIREDKMLHLSAVERTRKLRVKTTGGETTTEALKAYFEQGGATESIIDRPNFEDYVVTFANYEDAENVISRTNHILNDTKLDVSIFPPCLDLTEEFLTRIPTPKKLNHLDPYICRFLHQSPRYNEHLEYFVKRDFGRLIWSPEETKDCLQIMCDVQEDDRVAKSKIRDWEKFSAATVVETCKVLHVQYIPFAIEVLEGLTKEIREMKVSDAGAIAVFNEENQMVIVGEEKFVTDMAEHAERRIQAMEHTLDSLGKNITKILKVKAHEMELIPATKCIRQLKSVKVEPQTEKLRVCFNGKKNLVDKALSDVKETVKELPKQKIEGISMLERRLFQTEETRMHFAKKLREAKVTGVLALLPDDTLVLYSVTQEDLKKASDILRMLLKKTTIKITSNIAKEEKKFLAKLELDYSDTLRTDLSKDTLSFVSLDTVHEEIKEKIQHYLDSRRDSIEIIHIDPGIFRYIFVYKLRDIYDIVERHKSQNIQIDLIDKPGRKGFMISGEKEKCKLAIVELNATTGSVIRSDHIVSWDKFESFLQTMEGKEQIKAIELTEKCVLTLKTSVPFVPLSEKRSIYVASCKIGQTEIKVVEGDIIGTEANFIVCPTFATLELKRGLGGTLVEKGGFSIQRYCSDHIERMKSLKDADVFVGNAGSLTCKGIIYMILSKWNDGRAGEETMLSQAVYNCLKEADTRKSTSIAFPPVGIGQFGYPKEKVAEILMRGIKEYLTENGTTSFLRQVFVCDLKGDLTFLLVQEIQKGFGKVAVHTSDNSKEDIADSSQQRVAGEIISRLKTEIVQGSIVSEETDVIVNSTNFNLDLRVGKMSKVLLEEGGEKLAAECKEKYPEGISLGQLAETTGGLLKCKAIFHGILVPWNQDRDRAEIILKHFMRDCLIVANKRQYTSISFPVLGTGVFNFPPDVVADSMFDTIKEFEKDFPDSSVKTVRIVIRPDEEYLIKEFEKHKSCYSTPKKRSKIARASFRQSCQLSNLVIDAGIGTTFSTTIEYVTLCIEHGDLTKSTTSVIVNSVTEDLNLNTGIISKAILKAGGMSIQREANYNKKTFKEEGIVMTNAGQLLCQKIIHVKAKNNVSEWKKVVMKCLEECEKAELNSVSFPALGTGGKGIPASQMARTMIDAFKEFIRGENFKGYLKSITIVVYEQNILECFIKEARPAKEPSTRKSILRRVMDKFSVTDEKQEEPTTIHIYSESTDTAERVLQQLNDLHEKFDISLTTAGVERMSMSEDNYV